MRIRYTFYNGSTLFSYINPYGREDAVLGTWHTPFTDEYATNLVNQLMESGVSPPAFYLSPVTSIHVNRIQEEPEYSDPIEEAVTTNHDWISKLYDFIEANRFPMHRAPEQIHGQGYCQRCKARYQVLAGQPHECLDLLVERVRGAIEAYKQENTK